MKNDSLHVVNWSDDNQCRLWQLIATLPSLIKTLSAAWTLKGLQSLKGPQEIGSLQCLWINWIN